MTLYELIVLSVWRNEREDDQRSSGCWNLGYHAFGETAIGSALILESVKKVICKREALHEQQQSLSGDGRTSGTDSSLDIITHKTLTQTKLIGQPIPRLQDNQDPLLTDLKERNVLTAAVINIYCQHKGHYNVMCHQRAISRRT